MNDDRRRLTRSQPFTRWVRVPKRNASSSILVHLRFSFSSFSLNRRIQDKCAPTRRFGFRGFGLHSSFVIGHSDLSLTRGGFERGLLGLEELPDARFAQSQHLAE